MLQLRVAAAALSEYGQKRLPAHCPGNYATQFKTISVFIQINCIRRKSSGEIIPKTGCAAGATSRIPMINSDLLTNSENQPPFTRRSFLRRSSIAGAAAILTPGALMLGAKKAQAQPEDAATDLAVLNFALNLEYLEAEFYLRAFTGQGLEANGVPVNGTGTPGTVTSKANPQVPFQTSAFQQYAREIAVDERAHVVYLRGAISGAGGQPVARPAIDLQSSFNTLAQAAGVVPQGGTFDPFADEISFLIGAFIFEDVGVTAYKGAAPLISNSGVLTAAAGILAVEAYHAGIIRTVLFSQGANAQTIAGKISALRAQLSGAADDQGIVDRRNSANLVPTDGNSLAFGRSTRQVLNIVYGAQNASTGLFFPNGLNGAITT